MGKVAIIGVGQSAFVRSYPGSIRELVFEGFKEALEDAQIGSKDIDASIVCSAPEYDKQRSPAGVFAEYLGLNPQPTFYVETLCSSGSTGLRLAYSLIGSGLHDIVAVIACSGKMDIIKMGRILIMEDNDHVSVRVVDSRCAAEPPGEHETGHVKVP